MFRFIRRTRDLGFSIEEIGRLHSLWQDRSRASADVKALAIARAEELKRKALELKAMLRTIEDPARNYHGDGRPDCPILEELGHG